MVKGIWIVHDVCLQQPADGCGLNLATHMVSSHPNGSNAGHWCVNEILLSMA